MKSNNGILIGGFKAVGKTTLASKYKEVIDLESTGYEYIIDEELAKMSVEQRKGLKNRQKNPEYPQNYCNAIIESLKKYKIVLFAPKLEVVDLLQKNHIDYYMAWPMEDMLDEIIDRSIKRGNNEEFISKIKKVYYRDHPRENDKVLWIQKGQYLEDVLIDHGFLN